MKSKIFLALTTLTVTCALLMTALAQNNKVKIDPNKPPKLTKKVSLSCANGGGHQDVAKVMEVTNSSGQTINKNTLIYYSASDGDQGKQYPDAGVAPGKTTIVHGRPGQNYTCQAWVFVVN